MIRSRPELLATKTDARTEMATVVTGVSWRWQVAVLLVACVAIVSRRPDALTNPQFYAEDGAVWYANAYNLGWLHSLALPEGGYLNTFQRQVAAFSLLFPLLYAPLVMNLVGILVQALPANILLSPRCADWATPRTRCVMAAIYIALPNTQEIHIVLTNTQWHLALIAVLLAFARPAQRWYWVCFDVAVITTCALSGPFCIVLLPLTLLFWFLRRHSWTLVLAGIMAACSAVQLFELSRASGIRKTGELGASLMLLVRIVAGQIFAPAIVGRSNFAVEATSAEVLAVFCLGLVIVLIAVRHTSLALQLFTAFAVVILAGSLKSPLAKFDIPIWQGLVQSDGRRYWFFLMLAFLWGIAWLALESRQLWLRRAGTSLLLLSLIGVVHGWRLPGFADVHFRESAAAFEGAAPGTTVMFPEFPGDQWYVRLTKHEQP